MDIPLIDALLDSGSPQDRVEARPARPHALSWPVLIVDDDEEVHRVTRWVLKDLTFDERPLQFISAFSSLEAMAVLQERRDIALILLDVVMESNNSGLELAHFVRRDLSNNLVRIVLRTGHPGEAPEHSVMVEYEINDYREKTELTSLKLHTAVVSALRSFRDLNVIDQNRRGLEKIIDSLVSIHQIRSMQKLASGVLTQLSALLHLSCNSFYGHRSERSGMTLADYTMLAAGGDYEPFLGQPLSVKLPGFARDDLENCIRARRSLYYSDRFIVYFRSLMGAENVIYMEGARPCSEWDQNLIEIFCINVATAFNNIYLNQEIEDTQKEILFTLGEIAEARSHETGQHVKRVAEYSALLGSKYGLDDSETELLRLATPTHDVGKLAIPDYILNKPGKLTTEEFEIMKTHSRTGYEMLRQSERHILRTGALIALQHHERWDGNGYPEGLKGEEIHIFGRIVALADVFDALGNARVYKSAWPLQQILDYINEQRGQQFDPNLVDIFMANLDPILEVGKTWPDMIPPKPGE